MAKNIYILLSTQAYPLSPDYFSLHLRTEVSARQDRLAGPCNLAVFGTLRVVFLGVQLCVPMQC
jgi:hypothetical protein